MSVILLLVIYGMAIFKSTYELAEITTVAPTAPPLTTTRKVLLEISNLASELLEAWRPWPNTPFELYAYYHCGVNPSLSLGAVTPGKNSKVADWPMLVTVARATCGGGAACNLTLDSTVVTNVCMGVAVDRCVLTS